MFPKYGVLFYTDDCFCSSSKVDTILILGTHPRSTAGLLCGSGSAHAPLWSREIHDSWCGASSHHSRFLAVQDCHVQKIWDDPAAHTRNTSCSTVARFSHMTRNIFMETLTWFWANETEPRSMTLWLSICPRSWRSFMVVVHNGADLAAMDFYSSDPYCIVRCMAVWLGGSGRQGGNDFEWHGAAYRS